jgi:hypothetical protein
MYSYSRGFGLMRYLLGENHILNAPNCILGIVFYVLQLLIGWCCHAMTRIQSFTI